MLNLWDTVISLTYQRCPQWKGSLILFSMHSVRTSMVLFLFNRDQIDPHVIYHMIITQVGICLVYGIPTRVATTFWKQNSMTFPWHIYKNFQSRLLEKVRKTVSHDIKLNCQNTWHDKKIYPDNIYFSKFHDISRFSPVFSWHIHYNWGQFWNSMSFPGCGHPAYLKAFKGEFLWEPSDLKATISFIWTISGLIIWNENPLIRLLSYPSEVRQEYLGFRDWDDRAIRC